MRKESDTVAEEHVLVIPENRLGELGRFTGFRPFCPDAFSALLNPQFMEFRPRSSVEDDPTYKQLIPYVILQADVGGRTAVFQYTRGRGQGEKRLHALRSVGIGGHISREDAAGEDPYRSGMQRELSEEVEIGCPFQEELVGFIYDDASPVGRVHLGVVHRLVLESPAASAKECELTDSRFVPVDDLKRDIDQFETWSQLCLTHLF
ncbi:MAG: phosphoesterase [Planctomycetota bacterium]|nr:MAG: phosphoesterase [Planctomycetota bacterium]